MVWLVVASALRCPQAVGASPLDAPQGKASASLGSETIGNTTFVWTKLTVGSIEGAATFNVPPRRGSHCGFWGRWSLIRLHPLTGSRTYGEDIFNSCNNDQQVFPIPYDPRQGSCNNDDSSQPSSRYSLCPILPKFQTPGGAIFAENCLALAEASIALHADVTPTQYDSAVATPLTVHTRFDSDFTGRLGDATCSDVLDWTVTRWEFRWPDSATDARAGDGRNGVTDTHTTTPTTAAGPTDAHVTALAHIHVTAQAVDFDDNANPIVVRLARDVVISNDASADAGPGGGSVAVYTPPVLQAGAIALVQRGDGSLPAFDPAAAPAHHANVLRGRLLHLVPRAIVVRPGLETIDGVSIGAATTTTVSWVYTGGNTDAPPGEATAPGASGTPDDPVGLQWDHAERIDAAGRPIDEVVPLRITARSVYPDGHVETATVDDAVTVSIYYVGLSG